MPEEWEDILLRLKAAGLNWIETYTCWNLREPQKALYLPGAILKEENEIVIFETDGLRGEPEVWIDNHMPFDDFPKEIIVE